MSEFAAFEDAAVEHGIPARFVAQVARYPDRPAVVSVESSLTYHLGVGGAAPATPPPSTRR